MMRDLFDPSIAAAALVILGAAAVARRTEHPLGKWEEDEPCATADRREYLADWRSKPENRQRLRAAQLRYYHRKHHSEKTRVATG